MALTNYPWACLCALHFAGEGGETRHAEGEGGAGQAALRAGGHSRRNTGGEEWRGGMLCEGECVLLYVGEAS